MGVTYVPVTLRAPKGRRHARVRMLVDSGAVYSLLPPRIWRRLGLKPKRKELFQLADGSTVEREVSECLVAYGGNEAHSPVILGAPGDDEPLLGAVTLETLGLMLDPFSRRLRPMRLVLMGLPVPRLSRGALD
ncbi:MAG: aspartyl protease family protein [Planctomycetota bacterium]|nr:aspartyl protease family protein [Planctomycetota bacterium]